MAATDPLKRFFNTEKGDSFATAALTARHTADVCQPGLNTMPTMPNLRNYYALLRVLADTDDVTPVQFNSSANVVFNEVDVDATNGIPRGLETPLLFNWTVERISTSKVYPNLLDFIDWVQDQTGGLAPNAEFWYNFPNPAELDNVFPNGGV